MGRAGRRLAGGAREERGGDRGASGGGGGWPGGGGAIGPGGGGSARRARGNGRERAPRFQAGLGVARAGECRVTAGFGGWRDKRRKLLPNNPSARAGTGRHD